MKKSYKIFALSVFLLLGFGLMSCNKSNSDTVNSIYYTSHYIQVETAYNDIETYLGQRIDFTDTQEYNSTQAINDSLAKQWFDTQLTNIDDETLRGMFTSIYDSCTISLMRTLIKDGTSSEMLVKKVWTQAGTSVIEY